MKVAEETADFKYIVRLANTDIDGHYNMVMGLSQIKGIGWRLAAVITRELNIPLTKRFGDLSDEEVDRIAEAINRIPELAPSWMLNRRKDFDSGENLHVFSTDLDIIRKDDVSRLRKIRCYRGIRHEQGQKVRGQRTRSNGRTGATVGVSRRRK